MKQIKKVAVIGAGKMGRGIALLLLKTLDCRVVVVDPNPSVREALVPYMKPLLEKAGQHEALSLLEVGKDLELVKGSELIFEATFEDLDLKVDLLRKLDQLSPGAFYFSNTSSIPIGELNSQAGLGGRIIGFHFYNPPPVQKLLEVITYPSISAELAELATELGNKMGKLIVPSADVAGFIGNGHFIREISYACQKTMELARDCSFEEAVYAVDAITRQRLMRPMGIFQLLDYVGHAVCQNIFAVMNHHIPDLNARCQLLDEVGEKSFFKSEKGEVVAVFSPQSQDYISLDEAPWKRERDAFIGTAPLSWKGLSQDETRDAKLEAYFGSLFKDTSAGAEFAKAYLLKSKAIGEELVEAGVAKSVEDVNQVMQTGFAHLYGPVNRYY